MYLNWYLLELIAMENLTYEGYSPLPLRRGFDRSNMPNKLIRRAMLGVLFAYNMVQFNGNVMLNRV